MAEAQFEVDMGREIPSLTKTAYMPIDPNTRNVIHTDDYAKDFGMRGALIGGAILLSYVCLPSAHLGQMRHRAEVRVGKPWRA